MRSIIRKCWMLVVFISSIMDSVAQDIDPLIVDGKKWECVYERVAMEPENHVFEFGEDIVINGITYKQMLCDGEYQAALREEGSKVYIYLNSCNEEHLLYDFGLEVGQTYGFAHDADDLILAKVDYVTVGDKKRRRMKFIFRSDLGRATGEDYNHGMAECWVEGIGSIHGPANPHGYAIIGTKVRLMKCLYNDAQVFSYPDFFSDVTSLQPLNTKLPDTHTDTYNIKGQKESEAHHKLIIQNGCKVVIK